MSRDTPNNFVILQSLLNSYTSAWNSAKWANEVRYNEIVRDWSEMIDSSQEQFVAQTTEQNTHAGLFLGNLTTYMDELDTLVDANATTLDAAIASSAAFLTDSQTEYDAFDPAYTVVLDLLLSDYTTHAALARAFLTDLGTTELARINEQFAASLATQIHQAIDQGTYTSLVLTDLTARITRDKNEEIAKLNDGLNREKLANQHTLYGQQVAMRGQTLVGKDRLHTLAQEILRYRQAQTKGDAEALASHRSRAITERMSIAMARQQGLQGVHADNQRLMAYELDERNKLLVGLYGFVERRSDEYPAFSELTKIASGLGNAGSGGWITP